jgi:hypothetical protein
VAWRGIVSGRVAGRRCGGRDGGEVRGIRVLKPGARSAATTRLTLVTGSVSEGGKTKTEEASLPDLAACDAAVVALRAHPSAADDRTLVDTGRGEEVTCCLGVPAAEARADRGLHTASRRRPDSRRALGPGPGCANADMLHGRARRPGPGRRRE